MLRPDLTKKGKAGSAKDKAEALRTDIYSLASDMPKADCPSIAMQMSDSITRITEYLHMIEDAYISQNYNPRQEFLQRGIKAEIKMLTLLVQLAHERNILGREQFNALNTKIEECRQMLFLPQINNIQKIGTKSADSYKRRRLEG